MKILAELCTSCGLCKPECHRKAIRKNADGSYTIDQTICNDCKDLFEIQCIQVCPVDCIVHSDSEKINEEEKYAGPIRLRPDHVLYVVGILKSRGENRYRVGREWGVLRSVLSKAIENPDLMIRITPYFDDACFGCGMKSNDEHIRVVKWEDEEARKQTGIEFGQVIRFWDAVNLFLSKITKEYMIRMDKPDYLIEDFFA